MDGILWISIIGMTIIFIIMVVYSIKTEKRDRRNRRLKGEIHKENRRRIR